MDHQAKKQLTAFSDFISQKKKFLKLQPNIVAATIIYC
jgi:hypothetical protein